MAAFLQTLKETFADPGEALKLRWIDVDFSNNVVTINQPVKGHRPRQLKVSNKLLAMLNALPKASERIFPTNYSSARTKQLLAAGFDYVVEKNNFMLFRRPKRFSA